jgi:hypothetical protein
MNADVYWIVDHNAATPVQVKIRASDVRTAYDMFARTGVIDDAVPHRDALMRVFSGANQKRLAALIKQDRYQTDSGYSTIPTSVTGGGVDLSAFQLLQQPVGEARADFSHKNTYKITNQTTKKQTEVRAATAEEAVELALQQNGPSAISYPMIVHNVDLNQMVRIANDREYDSKIASVDVLKKRLSAHLTDGPVPNENSKSLWRNRFVE